MDTDEISFQYSNECDLEIHCSPFGLSGLYIKVKGSNIMGIGSTMGLITGSTKGVIHYNDAQDLVEQKYKLYVVVDDEGMLRIDFTKIFTLQKQNKDDSGNTERKEKETESPATTDGERSYTLSLNSPAANSNSAKNDAYKELIEQEEIPTLVFRGKCPEGRPDNVDPFIGIFSFERDDS